MRSHRRGMLLIDILLIILALVFLLRQISSAGAAFTDTEGMQLRIQAGIWETSTPTPSLTLGTNCTHSMGFWKTHPEAWPVEKIVMGGEIFDREAGLALLESPIEGEADQILARQLLVAKLNALYGAETTEVTEIIAQAVEWLTAFHDEAEPERELAISLAEKLDAFNRGEIGPGACEEESDGDSETPRERLDVTPIETSTVEGSPTVEPTLGETHQPTQEEIVESETPGPAQSPDPTPTALEKEPTLQATPTGELTGTDAPVLPTDTLQPSPSITEEPTAEGQATPEPSEEPDLEMEETPTAIP